MATLTLLSLLAILAAASAQGNSTAFPPAWNKLAKSPPMGWRSWNAFGANINDKTFRDAIDAVTAKVWDVGGAKASLFEVGYTRVGIDEGWENCSGTDPDHGLRQHNVDGTPMINVDKFPDLKGLVDYGHSKGVLMGWYLNGCACGEREERKVNYEGDVKLLDAFGFDAVKLDGCGAATNMTLYAELMQATGKAYETENCHWGHCGADSWFKNPDGSSCPTQTWAPFNHYRTSGDINSGLTSWFANLQTTTKFQNLTHPLSQPGVWAYPDMLEVGRIDGGSFAWNRAHFGAWCVVSAPLILGLDITDTENLASIVPIITNAEAIAVNQHWAGHPGRLVKEFPPSGAAGHMDGDQVQVWAKPQPNGALAVFVVNPSPSGKATAVSVDFATLGLPPSVTAAKLRDIWARQDVGTTAGATLTASVEPLDSAFFLLTPA